MSVPVLKEVAERIRRQKKRERDLGLKENWERNGGGFLCKGKKKREDMRMVAIDSEGYMNNEGGEGIDRVGEKDEWLFSGYRFW